MKPDLCVGVIQWLPAPGDAKKNLHAALTVIEDAASRGVDLVVLPELWNMGYNPETLAVDATSAAEIIPGPTTDALCAAAAKLGMWIHAGTIPERAEDAIYNTAVLINREGKIVGTHRKFQPYPVTGEHLVFARGAGITVVDDDELGRVGLVTCFDGDFSESQLALRQAGVDLVIEPAAYDIPGAPTWDSWYRAHALAHGQFWIMAGQCGVNPSASLLGASQIIDPMGNLIAQAPRCDGMTTPEPVLLIATLSITDEIQQAIDYAAMVNKLASRS